MAIGDNARLIIAQAQAMTRPTRTMLHIYYKAPSFLETPQNDPNFFYTTGLYTLSYKRYTKTGAKNVKRFSLNCDFMTRGFVKAESWEDLKRQAVSNEHVRFILDNTNLCKELFYIAAQNENMKIPFCIDLAKYDAKARPQTGKKIDEYAMIYNSYKPAVESRWDVNNEGKIELVVREDKQDEVSRLLKQEDN